jgi:hypothetical protein
LAARDDIVWFTGLEGNPLRGKEHKTVSSNSMAHCSNIWRDRSGMNVLGVPQFIVRFQVLTDEQVTV